MLSARSVGKTITALVRTYQNDYTSLYNISETNFTFKPPSLPNAIKSINMAI